MDRPFTPPPHAPPSSITPEATRKIEENRLRAKALQEQRQNRLRAAGEIAAIPKTSTGIIETREIQLTGTSTAARHKRPFDSLADRPTNHRDGRIQPSADTVLRPAKAFANYVDYNLSAMTDTKGGFLSVEDDPHGKLSAAAQAGPAQQKPAHMSAKEWERIQILDRLKRRKVGPFEPGRSALDDQQEKPKCRECGGLDIDWVWEEVFKCCVCNKCKDKFPERYSLLTKTECREDYLLTDPELRDESLLPHLSKPNPHKSHWHDMMLFLRCQVEDYAFGTKWGSPQALDDQFAKREKEKKQRKETKFKERLEDLKRKTRTEAIRRRATSGAAKFGDVIGTAGRHVHEWGRVVENEDGASVRNCLSCGLEVEELEF